MTDDEIVPEIMGLDDRILRLTDQLALDGHPVAGHLLDAHDDLVAALSDLGVAT